MELHPAHRSRTPCYFCAGKTCRSLRILPGIVNSYSRSTTHSVPMYDHIGRLRDAKRVVELVRGLRVRRMLAYTLAAGAVQIEMEYRSRSIA